MPGANSPSPLAESISRGRESQSKRVAHWKSLVFKPLLFTEQFLGILDKADDHDHC